MQLKLMRHPNSPLFYPNPLHPWEAMNVFNAAVTYHNGLFHMHYRAQGFDFVSRIGYAVSLDGLEWNRLENPIFVPHNGSDDYRGVEDPRVIPLDERFYMCYTAYGENSYFPMIAVSDNLINWTDLCPLEKARNKDHVLFPEKIGGRYAILHRRPFSIWLAYSDNLIDWTDHQVIMSPRQVGETPDDWDSISIGANGVPIKTPYGWLLFYHGYGAERVYRSSVALLDLEDPSKILSRPIDHIIEPIETWEVRGDVPNVIFSCTNIVVGSDLYFYYAGADRLIGLATAPLEDVLRFVQSAG